MYSSDTFDVLRFLDHRQPTFQQLPMRVVRRLLSDQLHSTPEVAASHHLILEAGLHPEQFVQLMMEIRRQGNGASELRHLEVEQ